MEAVALLLLMGILLGVIIGLAVKFFGVEADPKQEEIEGLLPGANCGACGLAGCADFAKAAVAGTVDPSACPVSGDEATEKICALLGLQASAQEPKTALVRCRGDNARASRNALYNGVLDCKHANLVAGGVKGCSAGCLGLGTCSRACPFGAIEMINGLAVVHADLCTGCTKCVATCPRDLITMAPKSAPVHVLCNSQEKGAAKRKVCSVACIGCRKCVKEVGDDRMVMDGMLARVNYDADPPPISVTEVCPTKCLKTAEHVDTSETDSEITEQEHEVVNA